MAQTRILGRGVSRRTIMMSVVAAGGALIVPTRISLAAESSVCQGVYVQRPRITAFAEGSGIRGSSAPTLESLEAYSGDADLVIFSIADEQRSLHPINSLDEVAAIAQHCQSHILVVNTVSAISGSFAQSSLIGPQGLISPFRETDDAVSWQTQLGVITAMHRGQTDGPAPCFGEGVTPDIIAFCSRFQRDIDHASLAYKVDLRSSNTEGPTIYAPNGHILTQAAGCFAQGVTAKLDVTAVRQARDGFQAAAA